MNENLYQAKKEFLLEWPFSKVLKMTLEEYTNLDKTSFCYSLEAKTNLLGSIWGGSSYKFGIYKRKDITTSVAVGHRITDGIYAWFGKYGSTSTEAFNTVKAKLVAIIDAAQTDELERIDEIDLGDAYKWKIAFLYGDFNVVNIFKNESLFEAAQSIKYKDTDKSYAVLNRFILKQKRSDEEYFHFTSELWTTTSLANPQKYWLYAPGENAHKWSEFYQERIMGLGWDSLGDLDDYPTKKDIKRKLQEIEGVTSTKQNDTAANYEFHKVIKEGDIIFVKKGIRELLGYGVVASDYYYDENRESYQKCRKVEWKCKGSWKVDFNLPLKTLTDITKFPTQDPNFSKYSERLLSIIENDSVTNDKEIFYNVKEQFIDWMISNDADGRFYFSKQFNSNKVRFRKEIDKYEEMYKVIFSADLFIVDVSNAANTISILKENIYDKNSAFDQYSRKNASGRPRAILGKNNYLTFLKEKFMGKIITVENPQSGNSSKFPLNQILYGPPGTGKTHRLQKEYFDKFTIKETSLSREQYLESKVAEMTWWQVIAIAVLDIGSAKVNEIYTHEFVRLKEKLSSSKTVRPTIWGQLQSHTVMDCQYVNVINRSEPLFFNKNNKSEWTIDPELVNQYYPEANELIKESKNYNPKSGSEVKHYEFVTFHQSFSYEDFIEGIKPKLEEGQSDLSFEIKDGVFKKLCIKAESDPENDYAIFIDEINRGNVSAIFGELITLIEEDKRLGNENQLKVKLPYSKADFGVPSNLYIIGTMNTADRSDEALDTALRRRFSFTEMMPNVEVVKSKVFEDYDRVLIMQKINQRIELLLDKNHTLGHSYFIKKDFRNSFENEIIPLLQEYFYNDCGKIGLILGKGFVQEKEISIKLNQSIFADFETKNEIDIVKSYELTPFNDVEFEEALEILLS